MGIQKPPRAVRSAIIKIEATKYDASRFLPTRVVGRVVIKKGVCSQLDASRFISTRVFECGGYCSQRRITPTIMLVGFYLPVCLGGCGY